MSCTQGILYTKHKLGITGLLLLGVTPLKPVCTAGIDIVLTLFPPHLFQSSAKASVSLSVPSRAKASVILFQSRAKASVSLSVPVQSKGLCLTVCSSSEQRPLSHCSSPEQSLCLTVCSSPEQRPLSHCLFQSSPKASVSLSVPV